MMKNITPEERRAAACAIAASVRERGGRAYYVGGCVRDRFLGGTGRDADLDLEIYGISADELVEILKPFGEPGARGTVFGIWTLPGFDIDAALPRREVRTGSGHRDFRVETDPFMDTREAAVRRDFTINAMLEDVLTGEVIDHFGGRRDIRNKRIRHIEAGRYREDPLRVLRAAMFAARFGFEIDPGTAALSGRMDISRLTPERVRGELEKALLRAPAPADFFRNLDCMGQTGAWFPEMRSGRAVRYAALDYAAEMRGQSRCPEYLMYAALTAGSPGNRREEFLGLSGRLRLSRPAKKAGLNFMEGLSGLDRIDAEDGTEKEKLTEYAFLAARSESPEDLMRLGQAVRRARGCAPRKNARLAKMWNEAEERLEGLPVRGRELAAAGMKPGKEMGEAAGYAGRMILSGVPRREALSRALEKYGVTEKNGTPWETASGTEPETAENCGG